MICGNRLPKLVFALNRTSALIGARLCLTLALAPSHPMHQQKYRFAVPPLHSQDTPSVHAQLACTARLQTTLKIPIALF